MRVTFTYERVTAMSQAHRSVSGHRKSPVFGRKTRKPALHMTPTNGAIHPTANGREKCPGRLVATNIHIRDCHHCSIVLNDVVFRGGSLAVVLNREKQVVIYCYEKPSKGLLRPPFDLSPTLEERIIAAGQWLQRHPNGCR